MQDEVCAVCLGLPTLRCKKCKAKNFGSLDLGILGSSNFISSLVLEILYLLVLLNCDVLVPAMEMLRPFPMQKAMQ